MFRVKEKIISQQCLKQNKKCFVHQLSECQLKMHETLMLSLLFILIRHHLEYSWSLPPLQSLFRCSINIHFVPCFY